MVGTMESHVTAVATEGLEAEGRDRGVLERVAAGDIESFAVLVERHQDRLVGDPFRSGSGNGASVRSP
jgi:hypothetical protein